MKHVLSASVLIGALLASSLAAAQARVDVRERNLEASIEQHRADGSLTPRQAHRTMEDLRGIRRDEERYRAQNGGHLNDYQRHDLGNRLDALEHQLERDVIER